MPQNERLFHAIADPTRRGILDLLLEEGPIKAGELAGQFQTMSRPAVSKHLRILKGAGLVSSSSKGRENWYSVEPLPLQEVFNWMLQYQRFWESRLLRLKQVSEES